MTNLGAFIIGLIIGGGLMVSTIRYFIFKYVAPHFDVKPDESLVVVDGVRYKLVRDEERGE